MVEAEEKELSTNREKVLLIGVAFLLFILLLFVSNWLLPKNCMLFEYRQVGFLCDAIDVSYPTPCAECEDERLTTVARVVFLLAFASLSMPLFVMGIRWWRQREENADGVVSQPQNRHNLRLF